VILITITASFKTLKQLVQRPDLLIYLQATVPTLVGQIQKRAENMKKTSASII
jgi:deoxyadenosine/deoxycytidine kinase